MKSSLVEKICFIILLAHVFLILFFYLNQTEFTTPDSELYLELSNSLRSGYFGNFSPDGSYNAENLRLPGYPFFILICQTLFGHSQSAVVLPQILLYLLSVFFIYRSTAWNFGERAGLVFLTFSLFYPVIAINSLHILPNLLSLFFVSAGVFSIANPKWRKSTWAYILCGLFLGLASYQRLNLFPLGVVFAALIFIFFKYYRKHTLILVLTLFLVCSPLAVRNYLVFGSFSPSANNLGFETMIYQNSLETLYAKEQNVYFRRNQFPAKYEQYESVEIKEQLSSVKKELGLNEEDEYFEIVLVSNEKIPLAKKILRGKAWENVNNSGVNFFTIAMATFVRMWSGKAESSIQTFFYPPNFIGIVFGLIVLLFAVFGVILLLFSKDENARFYGLICAGSFVFFSLSLSFFHSEVRYAMPGKLLFLALSAYSFAFLLENLPKKIFRKTL